MNEYLISQANIKIPKIIYGTAWKKEKTADLVAEAILSGFRGVDIACQPKHYNEALVGEGLQRCFEQGINRNDLFIQTKFTPLGGQDPNNIPYNVKSSLRDQVLQSFEVSKKKLGVDIIDSLVLHSPMHDWEDLSEVWQTFEEIVQKGEALQIGISNCYQLDLLRHLYSEVNIKPAVVQNRLYEQSNYDRDLRAFCAEKNIIYQSFWTLTANPHILLHQIVEQIASEYKKSAAQIFYRYLTQKNIIPLIGTTSKVHMLEDLAIFSFSMTDDELDKINKLGPFFA